jgi:WNK lysine deficient protein kinase
MDSSYHHYNTVKSDQSVDSGIHSPPQHDMTDPMSTFSPPDDGDYNNEDTTSSSILTRQLAAQYPEYENYVSQYPPTSSTTNNETVIDRSSQHDTEKVVEVSPNGRYARLNTVLGKGAYKIVYKAIDRDEGYEIAWNVLQVRRINNRFCMCVALVTSSNVLLFQISRQEFKDLGHEIDILKSVRHPNIITFHDAWHNDAEFIFITELMTSGTLREYIRKLSLPNIKIIKRWSRQILKGLAYLHSHEPPIIHRDLKCDNIFINGAHGEVKIGDLGTAQRTSPLMNTAKRYTVIGTPEFMAPEMYEEKGYNDKVDIYAFGMCLLEMATGEYPYSECKNAAQVFKKVTQNIKPESLSRVQNPEVLALINSCLAGENERLVQRESKQRRGTAGLGETV